MELDQANDQQVQGMVGVMGRDEAEKAQVQKQAVRKEVVKS